MKKITFIAISFLVLVACRPTGKGGSEMPVKDEPYLTPVPVKFSISPKWTGTGLKRVVVNGDNSLFVLTDKGYSGFSLGGDLKGSDVQFACR